jgi:hypothetical protein
MTDPVPSNQWGIDEAFKTLESLSEGSSAAKGAMSFLRQQIDRLQQRCADVEQFIKVMGWKFDGECFDGVAPGNKPAHEREAPHCSTCSCPPYQAWQLIETAPKDGTPVLGYVLPPRMQASLEGPRVVKWIGEASKWSMPGISGLTCSHWMPLPAGPSQPPGDDP